MDCPDGVGSASIVCHLVTVKDVTLIGKIGYVSSEAHVCRMTTMSVVDLDRRIRQT